MSPGQVHLGERRTLRCRIGKTTSSPTMRNGEAVAGVSTNAMPVIAYPTRTVNVTAEAVPVVHIVSSSRPTVRVLVDRVSVGRHVGRS